MRLILLIGLLIAAVAPAKADVYLLVCVATCDPGDFTVQPPGTAIERIEWDGVTPYNPGPLYTVIPDDGRPLYQPEPPTE